MKNVGKWLLPLLVLVNFGLVRANIFDLRDAVALTVALEGLLWIVGGRQLFVAWRRYRHERDAERSVDAALEQALATVLPDRVARLFALEARLWLTIARWLTRRGPTGPSAFSYHRRSALGLLVGFCVLTTPLELLLWEVVIPWPWLRVALFVLGIYGLIWVIGLYASLQTRPHQLDDHGVRVHYGLLATARIPYDAIAAIAAERRVAPKHNDGVQIVEEAPASPGVPPHAVAFVGVSGKTDVTIRLDRPLAIERLFGPGAPVTVFHLAADDPAGFVAAIELARQGTPPAQGQRAAVLLLG